eukprot:TRINITY_DN566_c0_g1_i3.p1 TRINITY_DN566_c0_g1~~TRINITY_DN566_c0_g1_i3.p1  ORF type:complete len:217 (-),score=64.55 TRINITY_DN566_c0_g1_i3:23-673(-)
MSVVPPSISTSFRPDEVTTPRFSTETLTELCLTEIVQNFQQHPHILNNPKVPYQLKEKIISLLNVTLPPEITVVHLSGPESEFFWKKCCKARWRNVDVEQHGTNYKRFFLEITVQEKLEQYRDDMPLEEMKQYLHICRDNVYSLEIKELLSHLAPTIIIGELPYLVNLNLTYGAKRSGINFDWNVAVGMKEADCVSMATAIRVPTQQHGHTSSRRR